MRGTLLPIAVTLAVVVGPSPLMAQDASPEPSQPVAVRKAPAREPGEAPVRIAVPRSVAGDGSDGSEGRMRTSIPEPRAVVADAPTPQNADEAVRTQRRGGGGGGRAGGGGRGGGTGPGGAVSRPREGRPATGVARPRGGDGGGGYVPGPSRGRGGNTYIVRPYGWYGSPYGYYPFGFGLSSFYWDPYWASPWAYGAWGYGGYGGYGPWNGPGYGGYASGIGWDTGSLRLKVKPRHAEVYADGYLVGSVDEFDGVFQSLPLEAGTHSLEIRADGYETLTFDIRLLPQRKITYEGELQKR